MFTLLKSILLSYISLNNKDFIQKHNSENHPYTVGENQFFERNYTNEFYIHNNHYMINNDQKNINMNVFLDDSNITEVDWRKNHKVSSVKNQGQCGSCWSFSSVGAVESAWAIKHNVLYNLSEQELVDCSTDNHGCEGGEMDFAFQYIMNNGLCTNLSYPYEGYDDMCNKSNCDSVVTITNYSDVTQNNETELKKHVFIQPVSVAIQANKRSFQMYQSGIYNDYDCGFELDHGVLVVGYGYDNDLNMSYWIIKNSWGESWGENGYIRIQRNINDTRGLCGVAMVPSYPIV